MIILGTVRSLDLHQMKLQNEISSLQNIYNKE